VHRAMIARGFLGHFPALVSRPAAPADALFAAAAAGLPLLARAAVEATVR